MSEATFKKLEEGMSHLFEYRSISKPQLNNFERHMKRLKDAGSDQKLGKTATNSRRNTRSLLSDVYYGIGIEAFVLCAISMAPHALYNPDRDSFLSRMREWWKQKSPHPPCLPQVASVLCRDKNLETLLGPKADHLVIADAITLAHQHQNHEVDERSTASVDPHSHISSDILENDHATHMRRPYQPGRSYDQERSQESRTHERGQMLTSSGVMTAAQFASVSQNQSFEAGNTPSLHISAPEPSGSLPSSFEPDYDTTMQTHRCELRLLVQEMSRCLATLGDAMKGTRWERMLILALNLIEEPTWAKECQIPPDAAGHSTCSMESAEVLCTTMGGLQQMLVDGVPLVKPVLVRSNPCHYETASTEFKERLKDRYSRIHFDVQDPALPATGTSVRSMKFEDVASSLLASSSKELDNANPPLNLLNLRDFLALPEPQFLRASRFQLLSTLDARIESAVTPEDSSAGKRVITRYSDLASCSRFLLYASRGAVSGPHVDILTGTWVQVVSGRKAWPIFTDLTVEERIEFEEQGNEWIPPREKTRVIVLDPGDLLVMPPGCATPHAPITVQDCLMHGGMFWDEKRILDTMETMSWIIQHPNVTNETVPNQLPEILFELERMMREKPERFINGGETSEGLLQKFEAAVRSMKGGQLGCSCKNICATKSCPCKDSGFPCFMYWCHGETQCSNFLKLATSP